MESINFDFGLIGNGYPYVALNATNGYSIPPSNSEELGNALAGKDKNGKKVKTRNIHVLGDGTYKYNGNVYKNLDELKKKFPNDKLKFKKPAVATKTSIAPYNDGKKYGKLLKENPFNFTNRIMPNEVIPANTNTISFRSNIAEITEADAIESLAKEEFNAITPQKRAELFAESEIAATEADATEAFLKGQAEIPQAVKDNAVVEAEELAEELRKKPVKPTVEPFANKGKFWSKFGKAFKSKTGKGALAALAVAAAGLLLAKACDGDEKVPAAEVPQKPAPKPATPVQPEQPAQEQPVQEQPAQRVEHKVQDGETYWGHAELDKITQNLEAIKVPDSEITEQTTELMHENNADWDQNDIKNKSKFIHSDPLLRTGDTIKIADYKARIVEEARRQLKAEGNENPTDEEIKGKFNEIKAKLLSEIKPDRKSTKLALEQVKYDE